MPDISERFDVAILGGGIAGLTLALQLKRTDPGLQVTVLERGQHPVPEAAHKVGESSVEVQAHYLRDVLGLEEHLERDQLHKFGLRMFLTHAGNEDITRRVEYGQISEAPLASYQLDRGRLENALGTMVADLGVDFRQRCKVRDVQLADGDDDHVVRVLDGEHEQEHALRARWVVDATGRAGLLKRKLGLARPVGHRANASWFRIEHEIDVHQWSDDEQWRARVDGGLRRLSTNHLMGPGYWVWLIPLASGSTSVGIVAEDEAHSFEGFNTLQRTLDWLAEHEPQCAAEVRRHLEKIQDFRVMKDYAYGCTQVYSEDRWCLTGEAGVSIDPLYSSGGDLMAISNGLITDLVTRDSRGEDVRERAVAHNQVYLVLSEIWLVAYEGQYPVMGNPQVMVAKVIWDTIIYWAVPGLLFFHDKFRRLGASPAAFANLQRTWLLHTRVQQFFREWHLVSNEPASDVFADPYSLLDFIVDLHNGMAAGLDDDELEEQFGRNVELLEHIAGQLVSTVVERLEQRGADDAAKARIEEWRRDELLREAVERYKERDPVDPIDSAWITLGSRPAAVTP
ncbi:NAD(P)/FAD-dependent oxidoreductase [Streptomyces coeruleorubidus]|uniref:NAD(P)/FAD-dependent oxidoreductase n=1 Tax=Streptomyces coeruleorubidus TaxID=116188 RepID=UPI00237FC19C|nr:NAD(P)/FAD-dependent oxidoreductase [Streptomyces coeruleorubidus]WDV49680.1 NAD(P)/FAD-dependent oxidoreductase [Streptomyces coeruleorubidus]